MSDSYALFSLPPRFDLDLADLERRYLHAAAAAHPDRFTDPLDQADAAAQSAVLNDAYRTLRDPESRARALLSLLGAPAGKDDDQTLPPELLMDMMEKREQLEEAKADNNRAVLQSLREEALQARIAGLTHLAGHFANIAAARADQRPNLFRQVRLELNALRYHQRMLEAIPQ